MAEENEGGGETAPDTNGLALDLAMEEARNDPTLHGDVARFLRNQNALVDIQKHHLLKQFALTLWEKRMGVALRVATAVVGVAVAGALAFMVWDASRSDGLSIEPFSVPPDLAATGLSGDVMAARLLDRINVMQAATSTSRAPRSVSGNWDTRDVKLAIPETGVSLAELENFLRAKLGHVSRLGGEMVRTQAGITLTARVSGSGAVSVSGKEADIEALTDRLAEQVYRLTQPYLYGQYLVDHRRFDEAITAFEELIRSTDPLERAFGYNGKGNALSNELGSQAGMADIRRALAIEPDFAMARASLSGGERWLGHEEAWLQNVKISLSLLADRIHGNARADFASAYRGILQAESDDAQGAYQDAVRARQDLVGIVIPGRNFGIDQIGSLARGHDMTAARQEIAAFAARSSMAPGFEWYARAYMAYLAQDWRGVLVQTELDEGVAATDPAALLPLHTFFYPLAAVAEAHLGNFAAAEAKLAAMPGDCTRCMIAHGLVAELRGQHTRADWWFAQTVIAAPSIPFANFEWGRALLERGKPDGAIAQLTLASKIGPHFADALEGWGEALMAKNQSHLALAKFAEAEKYAPNWGRLHLKWGEALGYAGKKDEAKAQFSRAGQLDLTPSEKTELAKHP